MAFLKSIEGQCRVEIISSDLSQTLMTIQNADILLTDIRFVDILHMRANISRTQIPLLKKILGKRGEEFRLIKHKGIYWSLIRLRHRLVLVFGLLIILFLSMFLPTRILFVQVEGNEVIPAKSIIETAERCGIYFFSSRRHVRSEKMKNALLHAIPQLQWAGVNTRGCVAVISVRERKEEPEREIIPMASSIVSVRDGIVEQITVLSGTPLCKVGQGVKKGQVLISGYTDCGLLIKVQRAEGEIVGQTFRQIEAVTLTDFQRRGEISREKRNFALRIGKKIIKFYKDSGISDTGCVKMYEEKSLTLPGGFVLPVTLITETYSYTDFFDAISREKDYSWMESSCRGYLKSVMVAGEILQEKCIGEFADTAYTLVGEYICREMLGQVRYEEIVKSNGN